MRKGFFILLLVALLSCIGPFSVFAAISGDPIKQYGLPFLITNAGQGPGGKMARLLVSQTKTLELDKDFFYLAEPVEAAQIERFACPRIRSPTPKSSPQEEVSQSKVV